MNEFKQWMNDCQGEWQKDPMFGKTEGRGTKLIDTDRKAYVDAQLAMLNQQSPLYAQHMRRGLDVVTGTAGQSVWGLAWDEFAAPSPGFNAPPKPRARILDPDFVYVPAAATDVTKTWRKFGWVPLSEQPK